MRMKYSAQVEPVKNLLLSAQSVLIALPAATTVDKLASGLALLLSLKQAGKQVEIATEDTLRVAHTNLFGIGDVKNELSGGPVSLGGGTFTLTLEGVVDQDGNINSEKLDYLQDGKNLQLIFTVPAGKKFEPERISTQYSGGEGSGYELIFIIGADSLQELGGIYTQNERFFNSGHIITIDNSQTNAQYGTTNVIDINAAAISEMMTQILPDLGLNIYEDIATNILTGIYHATQNMTVNVKSDTFMAASVALQAGGKIPVDNVANQGFVHQPIEYIQPQQLGMNERPQGQGAQSGGNQRSSGQNQQQGNQQRHHDNRPSNQGQGGHNRSQGRGNSGGGPQQQNQKQGNTQHHSGQNQAHNQQQMKQREMQPNQQNMPSHEDRPQGEVATSSNPEVDNPAPDWLVPKIYKANT